MKSKEKGWVSNLLNWGRERQMTAHERLYGAAIEIARRPDLFAKYGVTDDVDGDVEWAAFEEAIVLPKSFPSEIKRKEDGDEESSESDDINVIILP